MTRKGNGMVPNAHFHKKWERYVKTFFDQPMRKLRRRRKRVEKAKRRAPRPATGQLRPVVRCQTVRYNAKLRLGRGFTLAELRKAKINKHFAPTIGIAVDYRRHNHSIESLQRNVQRLKEYKSKLVLFPKMNRRPNKRTYRARRATLAQIKAAKQLTSKVILPIKQQVEKEPDRIPTAEERQFHAFFALRKARLQLRFIGKHVKPKRRGLLDDVLGETTTKDKKGKGK